LVSGLPALTNKDSRTVIPLVNARVVDKTVWSLI